MIFKYFKNRRINQIQIDIAGLNAELECWERKIREHRNLTFGLTEIQAKLKKQLARLKTELTILQHES